MDAVAQYPMWLRTIIAIELAAVAAVGGSILFLIYVLSGPLTPLRWLEVSGLWLGLPLLASALLIAGGVYLIRKQWTKAGATVSLLPLALLSLFIVWANI